MELVKTSYMLPKELKKNFKLTCVRIDRNMNEVIREIMNKWLIQQQNKEVGKKWKKQSSKN